MHARKKFTKDNVMEAMRIYIETAYAGDQMSMDLGLKLLDAGSEDAIRNAQDTVEYRLGLPRSGHAKFVVYVRGSLFGKKMRVCAYSNDGGYPEEDRKINAAYASKIKEEWRKAGFDVIG